MQNLKNWRRRYFFFTNRCEHAPFHVLPAAVLMAAGLLIVSACELTGPGEPPPIDDGIWSDGAIVDEHVTSLEIHDGVLYAGTRSDLFRASLSDVDNWEALDLADEIDGRGIRGFVMLNSSTILAGVGSFGEYRHNTIPIYRTTDAGQSWHPYQNGLGEEEDFNAIRDLDMNPNTDVIFAQAAGAIARSDNGGQSWERVYGSYAGAPWPGFLQVDPQNPEIVWRGSASPIFQPWLAKTEDGGENWDTFQPLENTEGLASDILIHPEDSDHIMVAIRGGASWDVPIRASTDGGDTWETRYSNGPNIQALAGSPSYPNIGYAAGSKAERTLFFARTTDFGNSWEIVEHEEGPQDIQVKEMIATEHEGEQILIFGTNKGVYSYTFSE